MKKLILAICSLSLSGTLALAQNRISIADPNQPQKNKMAAVTELSGEYLECSAYFTVTAYCMAGYPAPSVPKFIRDHRTSARTALGLAASTSKVARLSEVEQTSKLIAASQMKSIGGDCLNMVELSQRYHAFCKNLMEAPEKRLAELLEGRICTGLFKCAIVSSSAVFKTSTLGIR